MEGVSCLPEKAFRLLLTLSTWIGGNMPWNMDAISLS